jgi:hypothetical protein
MANPDNHDRDFDQEARIRFPWLGSKSRGECRLLDSYLRSQYPAVETARRRALILLVSIFVACLIVELLLSR